MAIGPQAMSRRGPWSSYLGMRQNDIDLHFLSKLNPTVKLYLDPLKSRLTCFRHEVLGLSNKRCDVPIVMSHSDLAPKNTIVNPKTKTITGIVDWEWSGPRQMDVDISEVEDEHEGFVNCKQLSKELQFEYFCSKVKECGGSIPEGYKQRMVYDKICALCSEAEEFDTWGTEEKTVDNIRETAARIAKLLKQSIS